MATNKQALLGDIASLLNSVTKSAEANTEPGSVGGATEHPIKNVDDGTQAGSTGSRATEYEKDLKDQQSHNTENVGSAPEQNGILPESPTEPKPTGEDATAEDNYKDKKDDPGTESDLSTENTSIGQSKYGSAAKIAAFRKAAAATSKATDHLLGEVHKALGTKEAAPATPAPAAVAPAASAATPAPAKAAEAAPAAATTPPAPAATPAPTENKEAADAAKAGSELASIFVGYDVSPEQQREYFKHAQAVIAADVALACEDADAVAAYLRGVKSAEDEGGEAPPAKEEASGGEGGGGGGGPPSGDAGGGGAPAAAAGPPAAPGGGGGPGTGLGGIAPEQLLALLQALLGADAGGAPGMDAGGAMGAMAGGGGAPGGAPPPAAGGGDPLAGGMDAQAGGGAGLDPALLQEVMQEDGLNPQEVAKAAAEYKRRHDAAKRAGANDPVREAKKAAIRKALGDLVKR